MQKTFANLAKAAYVRTQAECFIASTLAEMHKENPDLSRMLKYAEDARAALVTLRSIQTSIEHKTVLILSQLIEDK
jgi:hypothetical protein